MDELIKKILELAFGKRARLFLAVILGTFIALLAIFPYIDSNFLLYSRLDKRIETLDKLTRLDMVKIAADSSLQKEYDSILDEISAAQSCSLGAINSNNDSPRNKSIKFISGGVFFWFISLFIIISKKSEKKLLGKLLSVLFCIVTGFAFALLGKNIPTFYSVWLNAILFPVMQIVFTGLLVYSSKDNDKEK